MTSGHETWPWFSVAERQRRLKKMLGKTGRWIDKYGKLQNAPVAQATEKEDHEWRQIMFNSRCEHVAVGLMNDLWAPSAVH